MTLTPASLPRSCASSRKGVDVPGGLFPMLAQVVSTAARRAEQIEPDRDGEENG
ncbi:hypothetical protein ACH40D_32980 [Streptomyces olivaceoviridis]|uniref:Uncharacterized protein n=1 Tax=Streptomyces olivaceoviridis TaxID=1921 RepID=A0ABW7VI55_STROI|nr:hypothetical protein [Streptomyces corchorusii]